MNNLIPIEFKGQRILTTQQLAEFYETEARRISENFNANKYKYFQGKHYFLLEGDELRSFGDQYGNSVSVTRVSKLYLWTEKGALLHAKSLGTDKAWEVYDILVETYFRVKDEKTNFEKLSPEIRAIFAIDQKQQVLESRINTLENDMPLFNVECKELQSLVRKIGIKALGGYKSQAYNDNSLRGKIYADIQQQLKREFGVCRYEAIKRSQFETAKEIVKGYSVPMVLANEIEGYNNQLKISV